MYRLINIPLLKLVLTPTQTHSPLPLLLAVNPTTPPPGTGTQGHRDKGDRKQDKGRQGDRETERWVDREMGDTETGIEMGDRRQEAEEVVRGNKGFPEPLKFGNFLSEN